MKRKENLNKRASERQQQITLYELSDKLLMLNVVCVFSLNDFVLRKIIGSCFFFFQFVQFFVAILMIAIVVVGVVAIVAAGVALHLHSVRSCNILKNVYIVGLFHLFSLLFVRIFLTLLPMLLSIVRSFVLLWCRHMCTNMRI